MYIFVLDYDPNRQSVALAQNCSLQQFNRLVLLFLSFNIMLIVDQFYCQYCFSVPTSLSQYIQMRSEFFVGKVFPENICCFCVTIIVFQVNTKLYFFNQINCFNWSILLSCQLCLYIFVLDHYTNHLTFVHVYFCSWWSTTRSYILLLRSNKMYNFNQIYCFVR